MSSLVKYGDKPYGDFKPTSRLQELELIAFTQVTGEDVAEYLELINPKLRKEYEKLMEN